MPAKYNRSADQKIRRANIQAVNAKVSLFGYLGFVPKMGHTLWYVAILENQWVSLLSFSNAALKCEARDQWIGWDYRRQFGRLKLIAGNNRFLILPGWHIKHLASRTLALTLKRLADDWMEISGIQLFSRKPL